MANTPSKVSGDRDLVVNRAARHEYEIVDRFEAGLALLGSEVKSLRGGRGNLKEAFVRLDGREAFLVGCHISPYPWANRENHDPTRQRKLLLNRSELLKLKRGTAEKGMTVVPLRLYLKGSKIKLEIALARGRKSHDKRQAIKERDAQREMSRDRE